MKRYHGTDLSFVWTKVDSLAHGVCRDDGIGPRMSHGTCTICTYMRSMHYALLFDHVDGGAAMLCVELFSALKSLRCASPFQKRTSDVLSSVMTA